MHAISESFGNPEFPYNDIAQFIEEIIMARTETDRTVLIKIYSGNIGADKIAEVSALIRGMIPDAIIAGTSSSGEICDGKKLEKTTVINALMFSCSEVHIFSYDCVVTKAKDAGRQFAEAIDEIYNIVGIEIMNTAARMKSEDFFEPLKGHIEGIQIFGGGAAGLSILSDESYVFCNDTVIGTGAVCIVYAGSDLHISVADFSGWQPIGKEMRVTSADDRCIKQINGVPAIRIYEKYLMIFSGSDFKQDVMEFPLIIKRGDDYYPRIPGKVDEDGGLHFIVDVREGDAVRIAYGDPGKIIEGAMLLPEKMREFEPEYTMIIACAARQVFLKGYAGEEIRPFSQISSNAGYYSHGELVMADGHPVMNNSVLVAAGMREGSKTGKYDGLPHLQATEHREIARNPELVSKLTNFLEVMARE